MAAMGPIARTKRTSHEDSRQGDLVAPRDLRNVLRFEPAETSVRLGWVGLELAHYRATPAFEKCPNVILKCLPACVARFRIA